MSRLAAPVYDVVSGGHFIAVGVPMGEARRAAIRATRGKTVQVQGKTLPAIAVLFPGRAPKPGQADQPAAMFEDGREVPLP